MSFERIEDAIKKPATPIALQRIRQRPTVFFGTSDQQEAQFAAITGALRFIADENWMLRAKSNSSNEGKNQVVVSVEQYDKGTKYIIESNIGLPMESKRQMMELLCLEGRRRKGGGQALPLLDGRDVHLKELGRYTPLASWSIAALMEMTSEFFVYNRKNNWRIEAMYFAGQLREESISIEHVPGPDCFSMRFKLDPTVFEAKVDVEIPLERINAFLHQLAVVTPGIEFNHLHFSGEGTGEEKHLDTSEMGIRYTSLGERVFKLAGESGVKGLVESFTVSDTINTAKRPYSINADVALALTKKNGTQEYYHNGLYMRIGGVCREAFERACIESGIEPEDIICVIHSHAKLTKWVDNIHSGVADQELFNILFPALLEAIERLLGHFGINERE